MRNACRYGAVFLVVGRNVTAEPPLGMEKMKKNVPVRYNGLLKI
jgi:hypothetical protein